MNLDVPFIFLATLGNMYRVSPLHNGDSSNEKPMLKPILVVSFNVQAFPKNFSNCLGDLYVEFFRIMFLTIDVGYS